MQIISLYDSSGFTAPYYLKNQEKFPFIDSKIALQIKEATRSTKYRCPTGWKPYMTKQTSRTDKRSSQKKTP